MRIAISAVVLSPFLCPFCFFNHPLSLCRLRALSGGGGSGSGGGGSGCMVASPPLSPALPKYKLADYRYGREEMLALYVKDNKVGRPALSAYELLMQACSQCDLHTNYITAED